MFAKGKIDIIQKKNIFKKCIICDPLFYTMGHSDFTVSNIMGKKIGLYL